MRANFEVSQPKLGASLLVAGSGTVAALCSCSDWLGSVFRVGKEAPVSADAAGITMAATDALPRQTRPWESISEIILARKFKALYPSGNFKCEFVVIVFLKPEFNVTEHSDRVKLGISVSGAGRQYLLGDFRDGDWRKFKSSLERFSPRSIALKEASNATFDFVGSVDSIIAQR